MSSSSSGASGVQELRELVLVREEELKFAQWKLGDAKKRLQEAEALEWACEIESAMKAQEVAASTLDHQTPKASMPCQTTVLNAGSLVAAAQRFDLHGKSNGEDTEDTTEDSLGATISTKEWPSDLPFPPPPPTLESVQTMCPKNCSCGAPCTRIENMIKRQRAGHPYARTWLKHSNHTCEECQALWYQNKRNASKQQCW